MRIANTGALGSPGPTPRGGPSTRVGAAPLAPSPGPTLTIAGLAIIPRFTESAARFQSVRADPNALDFFGKRGLNSAGAGTASSPHLLSVARGCGDEAVPRLLRSYWGSPMRAEASKIVDQQKGFPDLLALNVTTTTP